MQYVKATENDAPPQQTPEKLLRDKQSLRLFMTANGLGCFTESLIDLGVDRISDLLDADLVGDEDLDEAGLNDDNDKTTLREALEKYQRELVGSPPPLTPTVSEHCRRSERSSRQSSSAGTLKTCSSESGSPDSHFGYMDSAASPSSDFSPASSTRSPMSSSLTPTTITTPGSPHSDVAEEGIDSRSSGGRRRGGLSAEAFGKEEEELEEELEEEEEGEEVAEYRRDMKLSRQLSVGDLGRQEAADLLDKALAELGMKKSPSSFGQQVEGEGGQEGWDGERGEGNGQEGGGGGGMVVVTETPELRQAGLAALQAAIDQHSDNEHHDNDGSDDNRDNHSVTSECAPVREELEVGLASRLCFLRWAKFDIPKVCGGGERGVVVVKGGRSVCGGCVLYLMIDLLSLCLLCSLPFFPDSSLAFPL